MLRRSFIKAAGSAVLGIAAAVYAPSLLEEKPNQCVINTSPNSQFGVRATCFVRLRHPGTDGWEIREVTKRTPDGGWVIAEGFPDGATIDIDWFRVEEPKGHTGEKKRFHVSHGETFPDGWRMRA